MSRKKSSFKSQLSPITELVREYPLNKVEKKKVDVAIELFRVNNRVLDDSNKFLFNELFTDFNDTQILYFVDKMNYFYFVRYLTPRNYLTTYFLKKKIKEIFSYKYNQTHDIKETKDFEDLLEKTFIQRLLFHKTFYENNRLEDNDFKVITGYLDERERETEEINILTKKEAYLLNKELKDIYINNSPAPSVINPYSRQSRQPNNPIIKKINIKPNLYNCIIPPPNSYKVKINVKNRQQQHFKNLMLCEENPVNNIVMKKTFGGCGNCGGIISGGKKRKYKTLKKKLNSLYVKSNGGCSCNQNGGFIPNSRSSRSSKSLRKRTKSSKVKQTFNGGGVMITPSSSTTIPFTAGNLYI